MVLFQLNDEIIKSVRWTGWWKVAVLGVAGGCVPCRGPGILFLVAKEQLGAIRES